MKAKLVKAARLFRFVFEPEDTSNGRAQMCETQPYAAEHPWVAKLKISLLIIIAIAVAIQLARVCN